MLFDSTLLFLHTGSVYNFTAGEYISLAGVAGTLSNAINLGTQRDLGIGSGQEVPKVAVSIGSAFVGPFATASYQFNIMGSTNSTNSNMITLSSVTLSTFSLTSNTTFWMWLPPMPLNVAGGTASDLESATIGLPQYYALAITSSNATVNITTGTVLAGVVPEVDTFANVGAMYKSNYTVA